MVSKPQAEGRVQLELKFTLSNGGEVRAGRAFTKFEFKGMVNGGYIIRARLFDPFSNLLNKLINTREYFEQARRNPIEVEFQLKWGSKGTYPERATRPRTAYLVTMEAQGSSPDVAYLEFVAVDPPSWHLNAGSAYGGSFQGNVSAVIRQVVERFGGDLDLEIGQTTDSKTNRWWMMRQDPKTFISSLLDWSSSVTQRQTHWLISPEDFLLRIMEQGQIVSRPRAYYRYHKGSTHDTIKSVRVLSDNALSLANTKLITAGLSAISGQYLDYSTDRDQTRVVARDATTGNKQVARVDPGRSYNKPDESEPPGSGTVGWTQIPAIPEFSAGDLGVPYENYIDGRPRGMYLNMLNLLYRARFRVVGHGEWDTCMGLGTDTFYVTWLTAQQTPYFLSGNWLAYGFRHLATRKSWYTDVYGARFDQDSNANKVGGGS